MPRRCLRWELPRFVTVLDEHTLMIPDRPDNTKIATPLNTQTRRGVHAGSHVEALIWLEWQIRASQESPVREPLTSK
jgi:hypothetical protein